MGAQSHSVSGLTFLVTYFASLIADCLLRGLVAPSTERIMRRFIGESTCVSVERLRSSALVQLISERGSTYRDTDTDRDTDRYTHGTQTEAETQTEIKTQTQTEAETQTETQTET